MILSPFVIFALPRSRTAWLSQWLAYAGRRVGHDIGIEADTCQDFIDSLCRLAGTIETGSMMAHRLIRQTLPHAKFVTVRRPLPDVLASCAAIGIAGQEEEMAQRSVFLDEIEAAGALRVNYGQLGDVCCCADLWEHLLEVPFDFRWWRQAAAHNIQIDIPERMVRLHERKDAIAALKREAANPPLLVAMAWEPLQVALNDCLDMAALHSVEVNAGVRHGHPFRLNRPLMEQMEQTGALRCLIARVNGKAVGYITWTLSPDTESEGVTVADQGAWFVDPDPTLRPLHIGRRLIDRSLADLRTAGIQSAQLHHQLNGRGANLGAMFRRLGAIEHQHRYTLWLGEADGHA